MELNCVLFIPVSSPSGIGEYMRSIIIAKAMKIRWPNINIHFILNDQVAYFNDCPYTVHACKDSPTKDVTSVNNVIMKLRPDLVIFDASGRAKQFKKAKTVGAKVAFISQHEKKRARGLKLNRLLYTDIHWVVQPEFCMKPLSFLQLSKLKVFNKSLPVNIGTVFTPPSANCQKSILSQLNLKNEVFFLFTSGSGGTFVGNELAADIFYQAACELYQQTKIKCVVVFGSSYPNVFDNSCDGVLCLKSIDNENFISLINSAHACVVGAGDTLLQCITLNKPCIAGALSRDQKERLSLCVSKNLVLAADLTASSISKQALFLVDDDNKERLRILKSMKKEPKDNALNLIISDLNRVIFGTKI